MNYPLPMSAGFFASLTPDQQRNALAYRGPEDVGPPQRYCRWPDCTCDMSQGKTCGNPMPPKVVHGTVADIPDAELLKRAVRAARSQDYRKGYPHPRWVAVMYVFALGSTYAGQLCRRFGLDPDEEVRR